MGRAKAKRWFRRLFSVIRASVAAVIIAGDWKRVALTIFVLFAVVPCVRALTVRTVAFAFAESHLDLPTEVQHIFKAAWGSVGLASVGFTVIAFAASGGILGSLSILALTMCWLLINTSSLSAARGLGVPPLLDKVRLRWLCEVALKGIGISRRWLGSRSMGEINPAVQLLLSAIVMCSIGAVGGDAPSKKLVSGVTRIFQGHKEGKSDRETPESPHPTFNANGPDASTQPGPTIPPSEATQRGRVTAREFCGFAPVPRLRRDLPPAVGRGLVAAYARYGAKEIGCPKALPKFGPADIYYVNLTRGQDDPALLVSDADGNAAVVFEPLVANTKQLIASTRLLRVAPRASTGLGEYQIRYLRGGRCSLALRSTYSDQYEFFSPSSTELVLSTSVAFGSVPLVTRTGPSQLSISYVDVTAGAPTPQTLTIGVQKGRAILAETRQRGRGRRSCQQVEEFDDLAQALANLVAAGD